MGFGVHPLFGHHKAVCSDLSVHLLSSALTYSEKHHHAEHRQQGGDHHTDEDGEFLWLSLLAGPLPGAARVLHQDLPWRRRPRLGLIDAGGEAVVEERSPLCHGENLPLLQAAKLYKVLRIMSERVVTPSHEH